MGWTQIVKNNGTSSGHLNGCCVPQFATGIFERVIPQSAEDQLWHSDTVFSRTPGFAFHFCEHVTQTVVLVERLPDLQETNFRVELVDREPS